LAIVVSSSVAVFGLCLSRRVDFALACTLLGGGLLIALVGFLDDRRSLSVGARFAAHLLAATWAVYMLGGLPPIRIGAHVVSLGFWGNLSSVIAIVWILNLFNFMDGIDGIAASEAVFITGAGGLIAIILQRDAAIAYSSLVLGAASLAFLCWNWPPAKIFMGDVGSGYLGYAIAAIALAAGRTSSVAMLIWFILGNVFFVDATVTLFTRLVEGERIYLAHRDHLYQRLAARWHGHRPVTLLVCFVNVLFLFPLALLSAVHAEFAAALVGLTTLCLAAVVVWLRAVRLAKS
jgi:Fuc2NAc and GlcNAc transferase